eukprot:TRINITY_DN1399_c0_g1_i2.p1 TRINITY_DN1399_c0_g1~~TRINITY_DN1399_c0_g1_i2.p1  ORF type:complete len:294 (-),score=43.92 TRINITY_DN1399_c0_g1_i2:134-1015(-)
MGEMIGGNQQNYYVNADQEKLVMLPFLGETKAGNDPRKENYLQMLKYTCCPSITIKSFLVLVTIFELIIFLLEVMQKGYTKNSELLAPVGGSILKYGSGEAYLIKYEFQLWRLITPIFLHASLMHVCSNAIFQIIFGISVEQRLGTVKTIIFYLTTGIAGNLLSAVWIGARGVGASTSIFGLLGSQVAYVILNWKAFVIPEMGREKYLFSIVIIVLYCTLQGLKSPSTDNAGHLGGLLSGMFLSLALFESYRKEKYEKVLRILGIIFMLIFFIGGFYLLFNVSVPHRLPPIQE